MRLRVLNKAIILLTSINWKSTFPQVSTTLQCCTARDQVNTVKAKLALRFKSTDVNLALLSFYFINRSSKIREQEWKCFFFLLGSVYIINPHSRVLFLHSEFFKMIWRSRRWILPAGGVLPWQVLAELSFLPGTHLLGLGDFLFSTCLGDWLQLTAKENVPGVFRLQCDCLKETIPQYF